MAKPDMTLSAGHEATLRHLQLTLYAMQSRFEAGISEFELISLLQKSPYSLFDEAALRDSLALFRCHFILFHCLYRLQDEWLAEKQGLLNIHTTSIRLETLAVSTETPALADPLRDYYLDWNNFDSTGKEDVDALIDSFWVKMGSGIHMSADENTINEARNVLEIAPDIRLTRSLIKKQYRHLLHRHHPDKGGENPVAAELVRACEVLLSAVKREPLA